MALHFGSSTLTRGDRLGHFLKGAESIPLPWPYTLEPIKTITSWLIWISKKVWKGMHVWTFKKWSSKSSPWFTNISSVLYHKNTTVVCSYIAWFNILCNEKGHAKYQLCLGTTRPSYGVMFLDTIGLLWWGREREPVLSNVYIHKASNSTWPQYHKLLLVSF